MKRRTKTLLSVAAVLVWTLFVCYPNPVPFFASIGRYRRFPIDPSVAKLLRVPVPDRPERIEKLVLDRLVPYASDWRVYQMPWYFPTPQEVLRDRRGDCESRAILLASLLRAKGIPFEMEASLTHIWVDYPGKPKNPVENENVRYFVRDQKGYHFRWPRALRMGEFLRFQKESLWDIAPLSRKLLLVLGWVGLPLAVFAARPTAGRRV